MSPPRVPTPGVWAPAVTLFNVSTDNLDLPNQKKYYSYLSKHLTGLVILGTNAETFLLTREERRALLRTAREAVPGGYEIMAGVSGHSTKQVLEFIEDAKAEGANYALVLPPAYFGRQTTTEVVKKFFEEVAAKSPLPIVIYNFPGVCNGIDLDSDTIVALHNNHSNVVGVKLTCASVGKMTRLAAEVSPSKFSIFGGQADFLVAGLAVGSAGAISALANICPKTLSRIFQLYTSGDKEEALRLQRITAFAETIGRGGIANTKFAAARTSAVEAGIERAEDLFVPRTPYIPLDDEAKAGVLAQIEKAMEVERSL